MYHNLACLKRKASSKACWTCKIIKNIHIYSSGIVTTVYSSIFKYAYGYSGIMMHFQTHLGIFYKMFLLKCLKLFWTRFCLDNYLVICTVTMCYSLHQAHIEFYHIQHSVHPGIYSGIFKFIKHYYGIITLIKALLRHIHTLAYSEPRHI